MRLQMMTWLIIVVLVAAGVYVLKRQLNKPKYYRGIARDDFPKFINGMMDQGGHGFLLFFEHEGSNRFLQFAKYIESPFRRNLHFGFLLAPWSVNYYATLKDRLTAEGFRCVEREAGEGMVEKFLCVDYITNGKEGGRLASLALDVLGIGENDKFTAHYEGPLSLEEWNLHVKTEREKPHM
jgi:hypothetical protein